MSLFPPPRALHLFICMTLSAWSSFLSAHEVRPAHLVVTETREAYFHIRWRVPAVGDRRLAINPVFDRTCDFAGDAALAGGSGASIQTWQLDCPEGLQGTSIQFENLSSMMTDILVQVRFMDGLELSGLVRPGDPVFRIPERTTPASAFGGYFRFGIRHILLGWDHLLFVVAMMLLVSNVRQLIWSITGFTLAHSVTLALAAFDLLRISGPPVEAVITLSVVLLAVEAARRRQTGEETMTVRAPWAVSIAVGLVHGLGFATALSEYGLPHRARFMALLAFNLGVEAGQLAVIAVLLISAAVLKRIRFPGLARAPELSARGIGVVGAFWLIDRIVGFF